MTPAALAALHQRAFPNNRAWDAPEFSALLAQPGVRVLGDDRAFIMIRQVLDEAEVLTLATHPDHRRQGLARSRLSAAESDLSQSGTRSVFLEVAEDNAAAKALYVAAGYQCVGKRPNYYLPKNAAPVAALVLRKDLLGA